MGHEARHQPNRHCSPHRRRRRPSSLLTGLSKPHHLASPPRTQGAAAPESHRRRCPCHDQMHHPRHRRWPGDGVCFEAICCRSLRGDQRRVDRPVAAATSGRRVPPLRFAEGNCRRARHKWVRLRLAWYPCSGKLCRRTKRATTQREPTKTEALLTRRELIDPLPTLNRIKPTASVVRSPRHGTTITEWI